jgi:hypothetical protein
MLKIITMDSGSNLVAIDLVMNRVARSTQDLSGWIPHKSSNIFDGSASSFIHRLRAEIIFHSFSAGE